MESKKLSKVKIWRFIGPLIVAAAILWAGPSKVWNILSAADIKLISLAAFLAIPMTVIKGIRWQLLLRSYNIELSFAESTSMYSVGMLFSGITPGRIGDLVKILMLIKKGCSVAKAIASNIFDRLFDVVFVVFAGYFGMWYFSKFFTAQLNIINIIFFIVLVLACAFFFQRKLIKKIAIKLVPSQYRPVVLESWNEIIAGFFKNRTSRLVWIAFWTIIFWTTQFFVIYLCGRAVGIEISFFYISACAAVAMTLSLLPITVAGVGTRDAAFILLLGQVGIAKEQSLAFSSLVLAIFLINCLVFYAVSVILGTDKKENIEK